MNLFHVNGASTLIFLFKIQKYGINKIVEINELTRALETRDGNELINAKFLRGEHQGRSLFLCLHYSIRYPINHNNVTVQKHHKFNNIGINLHNNFSQIIIIFIYIRIDQSAIRLL